MNVILYLINKFFQEEYINTGLVIFFDLVETLLKINGISFITANIIKGVENKNYNLSYDYLYYFIGVSLIFILLSGISNYVQKNLLTKMTQWVKREIFKIVLTTNDENYKDSNFIEFITPITRISVSSYVIFSTVLLTLIPIAMFLLAIAGYFLYKNTILGVFFITANIFIGLYIYYFWDSLLDKKINHEKKVNENEKYIINLLNNIDKVVYRGQSINEMDIYEKKTDECIDTSMIFYADMNKQSFIVNILTHIVLFISIAYLILLCIQKKIDSTIFVTFLTIMLFYRDRMSTLLYEIPSIMEFMSRLVFIIEEFKKMLGNTETIDTKLYQPITLPFESIIFKNVSYSYPKTDKTVFKDLNLSLKLSDKIVGITGLSGNGKSTLAKIIIKMYRPESGEVYIDNVNIDEIDPHYIRRNITYVNQSSKLFDKVVVDNMFYGCIDKKQCQAHFDEIMKYPKIAQLYRDIDIYSKMTGSLGEKVSGGQRQVINVISGLINPTSILILDEPTNALDIELKRELIGIIRDFKKYKKCIIIISHDKDVFSLFDEKIAV
jgi:ABC-type bacteriocin/lantibiotic exporter with double-glycine peptidase domain